MRQVGSYDEPGLCRANADPAELKEIAMHPHLAQQLAVQHVQDMRAQAAAARRVRQARRARRGHFVVATSAPALQPCPQLPCPPPVIRQPLSAKAA
jgi:hypothetical protein